MLRRRKVRRLAFAVLFAAGSVFAETQVVDGVRYECRDGLCRIVDDEPRADAVLATNAVPVRRMAQGYMSADDFIRWLKGDDGPQDSRMMSPVSRSAFWIGLLLILLGGLAMNLTPCVLPMIPINLIVIGRSAKRGAAYGLGIASAYGTLGVAASVGGLAFGSIQSSPWFNAFVAIVFAALALALLEVWMIDLSRFRPTKAVRQPHGRTLYFPFFMGAVSAVLAGACVAPVLISVLLLTGKLYAEGHALSLALPFIFGIGMALPWPLMGSGLKVLPKPGAWMKGVNRLFALVVLAFAVWYGRLAYLGFRGNERLGRVDGTIAATPETFTRALVEAGEDHPVLVDCWATWCKNCAAMEKVMSEVKVREALKDFTVIRLQTEDMTSLRTLPGFEGLLGLPAFVILNPHPSRP